MHGFARLGRTGVLLLSALAAAGLSIGWLLLAPVPGRAEELGQAAPTLVRVGVYILAIERFDTSTESAQLDFYVTLRCDQPCDFGEIEFLNGRATSIDTYRNTPTVREYRVAATLGQDLDLSRFPFDSHDLRILLENKTKFSNELQYVVDERRTAIDPEVRIPGWQYDRGWEARVENRAYPTLDETFSRYTFSLHLSRPLLAIVLRTLAPPLFIMIGVFASVLLPRRGLANRLTVVTSALVGSILFHLSLVNVLPQLDYLTFADRFMIVNYATIVLALVFTLAAIRQTNLGEFEENRWLALADDILVPVVWVIGQAINFWLT